jgi:succinoglycan biosynthesis protein ExoO
MLLTDLPLNPKVSIIIPAYNTEKYIARALQSALEQTEKDIEVIVVDDGSTDNTLEVIKSFLDKRIKLIINGSNAGPSHARNCALREARGDWIAILDSDDWYAPERLAKLLDAAYLQNADLVADDLYKIQDDAEHPWCTQFSQYGGCLTEARRVDAVQFVESHLPGLDHLGLGSTKPLIRNSFLKNHGLIYDESVRCSEDFKFYLLCLLQGACFMVIPEAYYYYRSRKGSITDSYMDEQYLLRHLNLNPVQHNHVIDNADLSLALSRHFFQIEQQISYDAVVQPLKSGSFLAAFSEMKNNAAFFSILVKRIPKILGSRMRRYFHKAKKNFKKTC